MSKTATISGSFLQIRIPSLNSSTLETFRVRYAALALYMRPDGEEKFGELQEAVGTLTTAFQQGAAA